MGHQQVDDLTVAVPGRQHQAGNLRPEQDEEGKNMRGRDDDEGTETHQQGEAHVTIKTELTRDMNNNNSCRL